MSSPACHVCLFVSVPCTDADRLCSHEGDVALSQLCASVTAGLDPAVDSKPSLKTCVRCQRDGKLCKSVLAYLASTSALKPPHHLPHICYTVRSVSVWLMFPIMGKCCLRYGKTNL